jgi:hypothetical protein
MKLQSEINWFKELSELVDNYELATVDFCGCPKGILRQDHDGSDSFTCCGSYGCGTNYSSQDISKDDVTQQLASCAECYNEVLFPLEEEDFICEECLEKMELSEEDNEDEEEEDEE